MTASEPAPRRVHRLQLGILLRRHREASGRATKEVLAALDWYPSKLSKLEGGGVTISAAELDRLVELYEVNDEDAARLRDVGREARRRGALRPVVEYARTYLDLEQAADTLKMHEDAHLPGMLQTEAHARALLATAPSGPPQDTINAVAADRARRGERFASGNGGQLWVVLGEAVLRRPVGGVDVHREQLRHLRVLAELPRVTLQVMPFDNGEYSALGAGFTIVEVIDPPLSMVYVEALTDGLYFEAEPHLELYRVAFNKAQVAAASERDSTRMLEARLRELA